MVSCIQAGIILCITTATLILVTRNNESVNCEAEVFASCLIMNCTQSAGAMHICAILDGVNPVRNRSWRRG